MKCLMKFDRIVAHKNTQAFHKTIRKQTAQGVCLMNERNKYKRLLGVLYQCHKTRLL